jgi:UDP-N-acetylglucosamine:LPS N-acetylglucosamine transferase
MGLAIVAMQMFRIMAIERPRTVVTTGSLPCCIGLMVAKFVFRRRTIWIDSIANSEKLSSSGRLAARFADVCLTQWPKLASANGPQYWGAVL